jgi:hypothetical protein
LSLATLFLPTIRSYPTQDRRPRNILGTFPTTYHIA